MVKDRAQVDVREAGRSARYGDWIVMALSAFGGVARTSTASEGAVRPRPRRYHRMTTSTYDVHDTCNLRCEGCSYFVTDRVAKPAPSFDAYDSFFAAEVARGVTYPIFSGAEPSLNQAPLHVAARHWRYGAVFTNGIKAIDRELPFRVVVSLWSGPKGAHKLRGADTYAKAMRTAQGDPRAVIFYTINRLSIGEVEDVVSDCALRGIQISFNFFSMTGEYRRRLESNFANDQSFHRFSVADDNLALAADDRRRAADIIDRCIDAHPDTVLFSHSLSRFMGQEEALHTIDASGLASDCAVLRSRTHLSFNHDLSQDDRKDCCAPDLDCRDCRVLGAALATLITRKAEEGRRSLADVDGLRELMMRLYYWDWMGPHERS